MEPKNGSRTESPADHVHLEGAEFTKGWKASLSEPMGGGLDIDEVTGLGATEVAWTPTRHEVLQLVKYWARMILDIHFSLYSRGGRYFASEGDWREWFAETRLALAENLLGAAVVSRVIERVEDDYRRSVPMTLREWDIYRHGTGDERLELWEERWGGSRTTVEARQALAEMDVLEEEKERRRQQAEVEEWREQHQAARDAARQQVSAYRFMSECVTIAQQVADAPHERAMALQLAALAAKVVARLSTNELLENDTQQRATLLAARLIDSLQLEVQ